MPLENFSIGRVCLHEVYRRANDGSIVAPRRGQQLLTMDARGQQAFESRVINAFSSSAKCMEMVVLDPVAGSVTQRGFELLSANDGQFVDQSYELAELLAQAQGSRSIPGGVLAVFDGLVGHPARRFFAVMKAELQEAFLREDDLQATFVDNLFLSPKGKLYKIGLFVQTDEEADGVAGRITPQVFDSHLSARDRDGAATYFHSGFLGLGVPDNAAFNVRKFFENTKQFIASSNLEPEDKVDLHNSLFSYLKVDQSPTIQVNEFAERFFAGDLEVQYREFMNRSGMPPGVMQKDLSEVQGQLRLRRVRFPRRIQLLGPAEAMADLVTIQDIESDDGHEWTQITIRGRVQGQE